MVLSTKGPSRFRAIPLSAFMKRSTLLSSSIRPFGFALAIAAAILGQQGVSGATGMIMPVFGNTASQFNAAIAAAQKVPMIAIINPDNGPCSSKVSGISGYVSRLRGTGAKVVGYISTAYGSTSQSSVDQQIDRYVSWYGATGVFLDEMSDRTGKVSYYAAIYSYAKRKGLFVVGNPGTFLPAAYAAVADVLVTYEDPLSNGWNSQAQSSWTAKYAPSNFGAIVYAASSSSMNSIVNRAVSLRYGWIFATDAGGSDPFGRAPSYIAAEAAYIKTK